MIPTYQIYENYVYFLTKHQYYSEKLFKQNLSLKIIVIDCFKTLAMFHSLLKTAVFINLYASLPGQNGENVSRGLNLNSLSLSLLSDEGSEAEK